MNKVNKFEYIQLYLIELSFRPIRPIRPIQKLTLDIILSDSRIQF